MSDFNKIIKKLYPDKKQPSLKTAVIKISSAKKNIDICLNCDYGYIFPQIIETSTDRYIKNRIRCARLQMFLNDILRFKICGFHNYARKWKMEGLEEYIDNEVKYLIDKREKNKNNAR